MQNLKGTAHNDMNDITSVYLIYIKYAFFPHIESGLSSLLSIQYFYPNAIGTRSCYYHPYYCMHHISQSCMTVVISGLRLGLVDSCVNLHAECGDSVQSEIREDKISRLGGSLQCVRACVCVCCLFTIQQQQTDPGFGVSVITDSEETLEENIHNRYILLLTSTYTHTVHYMDTHTHTHTHLNTWRLMYIFYVSSHTP